MKHKFPHCLAAAFLASVAALTLQSCSDNSADMPAPGGEGFITISLASSSAGSRAESSGEDRLNENFIGTTHLFFYADNASDSDQPVYETVVSPSTTYYYTANLLLDKLNTLFGEAGNTCKVFAISNVPTESIKASSDHSRQALKNIAISSDFNSTEAQESFVMSGESTVTLNADRNAATGAVSLKRTAAKIIVSVSVSETTLDTENNVWESDHRRMYVSMAHGVYKSSVVAQPSVNGSDKKYTIPITTTDGHKFVHHDENETYKCVQDIPFYSYPNQWTSTDSDRPYITLVVLWTLRTEEGGASAQYCYYQIPINRNGGDNRTFESNNIYRINIHVDKLGRFVPNEPLELDNMSLEVIDWGTASTDVEINDFRYLVLNQTEFVMNNENEITIPFFSSHNVEFGNVELRYWRYNENTNGTPIQHKVSPEQNVASRTDANDPRSGIYDITVDNDKKTMTFYHDLKKTWTLNRNGKFTPNNEDAYSPYEIVITVYHKDKNVNDPDYAQTINLTQYPAMYIQVLGNHPDNGGLDNTFINNNNKDKKADEEDKWKSERQLGYIDNGESKNSEYYIGSKNSGNANNSNYNNYVINVTKLNPGANYKIADPRQDKINNNLNSLVNRDGVTIIEDTKVASWSVSAPSLYDLTNLSNSNEIYNEDKTQRLLAFYYPTDETAAKQRFIAPSFTVASSLGATLYVPTKKGARRRCASYQENGRPAGRWRLPTPGEVQYIVELSKDNKIPRLFGSSSGSTNYWTSYGYITVTNGDNASFETKTGTPSTPYVRCVYDEWYWKDKAPVNTFTWGDREMDDPQNPSNSINP